jgi:hypothetical protein
VHICFNTHYTTPLSQSFQLLKHHHSPLLLETKPLVQGTQRHPNRHTQYSQCRSYFPGHIHAFYVEYIYYKRRDEIRAGTYDGSHASGIYSQKVQHGGMTVQPPVQPAVV